MRPISLLLIISVLAFAATAGAVVRPGAGPAKIAGTNADGSPIFKELRGDAREKEIARVEKYLSGLTTMTADFAQTSSDGSNGDGTFYLKRPGKMHWEYNPPSKPLLVSNGRTITYYDPGVDQISYIPVDSTLASFLTREDIEINNDSTELKKFGEAKGFLSVTLIQRKKPAEGSMTLEFSDKPLKIKKITTIDATGNETIATFKNVVFGSELDNKLFVFKDPRGINYRRNKKK